MSRRSLRIPLLLSGAAVVLIAIGATVPPVRSAIGRFLSSLRMQKVQTVSVDLSSFVGPNANPTIQQMISQMISDKVNVTVNEPEQAAPDVATATRLAGFPVHLPKAKQDAPELAVGGAHAFTLTVDRERLQSVLQQAGRSDLVLPASIDGAAVAVSVPRTVRARYGTCPGPQSATTNVATPAAPSTQFDSCVILTESRAPVITTPNGLDVGQLAQMGLEVAGMSPTQAQDFLQTVSWRSILGVSVPRVMRSYEAVTINGAQGTLLDMAGRRGPTYALIWSRDDLVYTLTGFGGTGEAVALAESVQ